MKEKSNLSKAKESVKNDFFDEKSLKILIPIVNMVFTFFIFNMVFSLTEYGKISPLTLADILFSMYLGVITYLLILGICGRTLLSTIIYDVLAVLLIFVNKLKIMYVGEPLYLLDAKFLVNIGGFSKLAFGNLSFKALCEALFPTLFMALWALIMIILNYKYRSKIKPIPRIVIIVLIGIMFFILAHPTRSFKAFMEKNIFLEDAYEDYYSYVDDKSYYFYYGYANGLYGNYLNKFFFEPDGYNEEEVIAALKTKSASTGIYGKPNIILWFSESFFDVQKMEGVHSNIDIIPNFRNLSTTEKSVNILSPTYGGASENVAFEVLTSGSMRYFPNGFIPVMSLYDSESSKENPSIVKELKNSGYKTSYVFGKDFYNSKVAYTNMGFDNYIDLSKNDNNITDELITKEVINMLKNSDETQFIAVASYEAHMPYNIGKYNDYHIQLSGEENYSEKDIKTLNSFAESIYRADKQLEVLYEYIQTIDEPTIIIFMPDHLPYLYTEDNNNLMDRYIWKDDGSEDYFRKYNNEGLILSNYDLDFSEIPEYIGADQLLNAIVQQTEVDLGSYYDYLYSNLDIYSGMNKFITVKKDGIIPSDIPEIINKTDKTRRDLQYKLFLNN